MSKLRFFSILSVILIVQGCYNDNTEELYGIEPGCPNPPEERFTWADNVSPIISASCGSASCHGAGNGAGREELVSYENVKNAIEFHGLEAYIISGEMPKNGTIAPCDTAAILRWIRDGYQNN